MANTTDIKKGLTIELNKDLWTIVDFQHVKPGKAEHSFELNLRV